MRLQGFLLRSFISKPVPVQKARAEMHRNAVQFPTYSVILYVILSYIMLLYFDNSLFVAVLRCSQQHGPAGGFLAPVNAAVPRHSASVRAGPVIARVASSKIFAYILSHSDGVEAVKKLRHDMEELES